MTVRRVLWHALSLALILPLLSFGQGGTIGYKLDGKTFNFTDGKLEYHKSDGYISLTCERSEVVPDPTVPDEKKQVAVGMTIQLAKPETELAGDHRSSTPDEMPTHFTWYEFVPTEDGKAKRVKEFLAGLDDGDESKMFIRLRIEKFGPPGSMIQGTFSGKLFDEAGRLHEITEGVFSVPRIDIQ